MKCTPVRYDGLSRRGKEARDEESDGDGREVAGRRRDQAKKIPLSFIGTGLRLEYGRGGGGVIHCTRRADLQSWRWCKCFKRGRGGIVEHYKGKKEKKKEQRGRCGILTKEEMYSSVAGKE